MTRQGDRKLTAAQLAKLVAEVQPVEVEEAADAYRTSLLARADAHAAGLYPLWHGWALRDAFVAGYLFAGRAALAAEEE